MREPLQPTVLPRRFSDLPPLHGRLGGEPEHFVVEERLAYEPCGTGEHLYLWVEKRDLTTHEAIRRLAHFLDRPTHSFGIAGLKDRRAVTRQWISVERVEPERLHGWTINGVRVMTAIPHQHKLRLGHAKGNRFVLTLEGLEAAETLRLQQMLERLSRFGMPNAYGPQRFGRGGASLRAGFALLRRDEAAFLRETGRPVERTERRLRSLLLSALQSEAFNRVLCRRLNELDTVELGDVAYLHSKGAAFIVEDLAREQTRAERCEISASGPIPGTHLLQGHGRPRKIEDQVLEELGAMPSAFEDLPAGLEARGARRPLRVFPEELRLEVLGDGNAQLQFALPTGSYATVLLAELLDSAARAPLEGEEGPIGDG
ncbi:MAG: tRNA pseudouridine(13) synthase TruD [Planctomycetes bacterium]|nr:tRNA pseudouridine(13) synthase TruD [Planctomycetota bacterium]